MLWLLPEELIIEIVNYYTFGELFLVNKLIHQYLQKIKHKFITPFNLTFIKFDILKENDYLYKFNYFNKTCKINAFQHAFFDKDICLYINKCVQLVVDQTVCSKLLAFKGLCYTNFDIVYAIMYVTR